MAQTNRRRVQRQRVQKLLPGIGGEAPLQRAMLNPGRGALRRRCHSGSSVIANAERNEIYAEPYSPRWRLRLREQASRRKAETSGMWYRARGWQKSYATDAQHRRVAGAVVTREERGWRCRRHGMLNAVARVARGMQVDVNACRYEAEAVFGEPNAAIGEGQDDEASSRKALGNVIRALNARLFYTLYRRGCRVMNPELLARRRINGPTH